MREGHGLVEPEERLNMMKIVLAQPREAVRKKD